MELRKFTMNGFNRCKYMGDKVEESIQSTISEILMMVSNYLTECKIELMIISRYA